MHLPSTSNTCAGLNSATPIQTPKQRPWPPTGDRQTPPSSKRRQALKSSPPLCHLSQSPSLTMLSLLDVCSIHPVPRSLWSQGWPDTPLVSLLLQKIGLCDRCDLGSLLLPDISFALTCHATHTLDTFLPPAPSSHAECCCLSLECHCFLTWWVHSYSRGRVPGFPPALTSSALSHWPPPHTSVHH